MNFAKNKFFTSPLFFSIFSGLLLFGAWPMSPFTFLIFFAFIPLLCLSNLNIGKGKYFLCIYLAMLIWNVSTTWWIWYASPPGAFAAFLANSLLMTLPWLLYKMVKKRFSKVLSFISLISFWMLWEYTHLQDWGLSWPWLTVGNVFANSTDFIQWYQYTGVSGGSLLVFVLNILIYEKWNQVFTWWKRGTLLTQKKLSKVLYLGAILLSTLILYLVFYIGTNIVPEDFHGPDSGMLANNIVICQPNIDPYEKLASGTFNTQLNTLINTSKIKVDSNTTLLIWPETALYNDSHFDENNINGNHQLDSLFSFLQQYPNLHLFTGIESYKVVDKPTKHSRKFYDSELHYESYNSSVLINKDGPLQFYHKSMLVPGVETLPSFLNFMGKWFEDFGGTTNGYVKQDNRTPLVESVYIKIAPSICYESIYGSFMSKYVNNGANVISIITNDGWWRNTPGHQQHFAYASLRAIENRTWVLRSANTGISGFINPYGEVVQKLDYNKNGAIKMTAPLFKNEKTFYTKHPDLLYKIAIIFSVLLMLWYNIALWKNR
jgi:apolipoprotein N-acyltransferase